MGIEVDKVQTKDTESAFNTTITENTKSRERNAHSDIEGFQLSFLFN
jgi:hypothetical protein